MSELTPKVNSANFDDEVLKAEVPVLVDFWAEWCGPCRAIAPVLEEVAPSYQGKLKILKLNVDEESDQAAKYSVQSIPTLIMFKQGQEVDRIIGALPKDELQNRIEKAIA